MKTFILSLSVLGALAVQAQKKDQFFAISSTEQPNEWLNIQRMQLNGQQSSQLIYDYRQKDYSFLNGYTRRPVRESVSAINASDPTETMVAAAAYNSITRQLFFIPMKKAELRWMEWSENRPPVFLSVPSPVLSQLNMEKPENQITRMTIGADGFGYALTNDGNHLIRFTTGSRPSLTDLGNIIDASSNGQLSVHSQCSSWGGDLVAAADGSLYLITMRNSIYQIIPGTRVATYKGVIKGLPQNFYSNAAAATEDGNLIVGCSYGDHNCFLVDMNSFEARPAFSEKPGKLNYSDLASGYMLFSRSRFNNGNEVNQDLFTAEQYQLQIYPNPITENRFKLNFKQTNTGMHTIQVTDLSGQLIRQTMVQVSGRGQAFHVELPAETAKGLYLVRVTDHTEKTVHVSKIVLQ
jgi:hypothetical protein